MNVGYVEAVEERQHGRGYKKKEKEKEMGFAVEEGNNTTKTLFEAEPSPTRLAFAVRSLADFILFPVHLRSLFCGRPLGRG